jgi:hypothetical protein
MQSRIRLCFICVNRSQVEPLLHADDDAKQVDAHLAGWREKAQVAIILDGLSSAGLSCWEVVCRFGVPLGKAIFDEGPLAVPLASARSKAAREIVADISEVVCRFGEPLGEVFQAPREGSRRMPTEVADKCVQFRRALGNAFGAYLHAEMEADCSLLRKVARLEQMELLLDCRALAAAASEASDLIIGWQKLAEVDDKAGARSIQSSVSPKCDLFSTI